MIAGVSADARVGITGVGAHVPDTVLASDELARRLDLPEGWILERSGIRERRIAAPADTLGDLAGLAARRALEDAHVDPADIDLLIIATATPELLAPATAAGVAADLGALNAAAYDLSAASTGFVYGLAQAYAMVASGLAKRALVVGAELLSRVMDWGDRSTAILFGDGSGAVVLEQVRSGGFVGFELGCDGSHAADLTLAAGGTVQMNGPAVYRFSTRVGPASVERLLERCNLSIDAIDLYVPHQSNRRIVDHTVRALGLAEDKVMLDIDRYGNTSAASIPLALADALRMGRLRPGDLVLMAGVGAGFTWGSALLRWDADAA